VKSSESIESYGSKSASRRLEPLAFDKEILSTVYPLLFSWPTGTGHTLVLSLTGRVRGVAQVAWAGFGLGIQQPRSDLDVPLGQCQCQIGSQTAQTKESLIRMSM
jgi:hypothetical protein